jgi:CBS domain-containing protein
LADQIAQSGSVLARRQATLIVDNDELVGIVTRGDLLRAQRAEDASTITVLRAGTTDPVTTFADETLEEAMNKMLQRNIGRLPVVDRRAPRKIVGYLGRAEILAAKMRHREDELRREKGPLLVRNHA